MVSIEVAAVLDIMLILQLIVALTTNMVARWLWSRLNEFIGKGWYWSNSKKIYEFAMYGSAEKYKLMSEPDEPEVELRLFLSRASAPFESAGGQHVADEISAANASQKVSQGAFRACSSRSTRGY
jgi:hypothetical protein